MSSGVARLGFGIAGATIGSFFGVPGLGFVAGSAIGALLFPPDPTVIEGPRLNELQVAISEYGAPIPIIYATVRLGGNYFWATDIVEKVTKQTESGKGGGGGTVTRTYTYFGNFGVQFCETVDKVLQVYADNKLIADFTNTTEPVIDPQYIADGTVASFLGGSGVGGGGGGSGGFRIHLGNEDQVPDFLIEEIEGLGTVSAQRGVATIVFDDFPLENFGNRIPQISAVLCTQCLDAFPIENMPQWTENSDSFYWGRDGVSLFNDQQSNHSVIVNSQTREFIVAPGDVQFESCNGRSSFGPFDTSRFGEVLTKTENLSSVNSINLHNPLTGAALACSALGTSEIVTAAIDCRFYGPNDDRCFAFGTGVEDNEQSIYRIDRFLLPDGTVTHGITFVHNYTTADRGWTGDRHPDSIRVHPIEETAWYAVRHDDGGGTDSLLIRCDHDGLPEDIYNLGPTLLDNFGYDGATNSWFIYYNATRTFKRWSIDDEQFDQLDGVDLETAALSSDAEPGSSFRQGSVGGFFYMSHGSLGASNVTRINTVTMELEHTYDIVNDFGSTVEFHIYDPILHATIASPTLNTPVRWHFLDRGNPDGVTLRSIVEDIVLRAGQDVGLTLADIDATALTDLVKGYVLTNRMISRRAIEALQPLYFFDSVETDHLLRFPKRGTAAAANLVDADLGAGLFGGKNRVNKLEKQRAQEVELPQRQEVSYMDPAFDYQEGLQAAHRAFEVVTTRRIIKSTFPVVLTADEAAQRSEVMLFKPWLERTTYRMVVGPEHLFIDPGDQITVTADGEFHSVRVVQTQWGANGLYKIEGVGFKGISVAEVDSIYQNAIVLDTTTTGGAPDGFIAPAIGELNPTILTVLDAPILRETDNGFSLYFAARGLNGGTPSTWEGAIVNRSVDGLEFDNFTYYPPSQEAEVGTVTSVIPGALLGINATRWTIKDTTSTVTVSFPEHVALASVSDIDLLNGSNLYLVGTEYISIQTWVDNGDGSWTGSNMLRGRFGTESQVASHALREPIVVIDENKLFRVEMSSDNLGIVYTYQSITFNAPQDDTGSLVISGFTGKSMFPYPPANPTGVSSTDWTFNWVERARHSHRWKDTVDTPSSETTVDYDIDILSEDLLTVVRTITSTASANGSVVTPATNSAHYDVLDMQDDFNAGSPLVDSYGLYRLYCDFYMRNPDSVGRGYKRRVLIEDFPEPLAADASFSSVQLFVRANSVEQVADKSQNKHPITVGDALTLTKGDFADSVSQFGSGVIEFSDTPNSELVIPRALLNQSLDLGAQNWTMEAWLHQDGEHQGDIVSIWGSAGNREWAWSFDTGGSDNGAMDFSHTNDGSTSINSGKSIPSGNTFGLVHVAVVREGTTGRYYQNGVELTTGTALDFTGGPIFSGGNADLIIGSRFADDSNHFVGKLDSLRITVGVVRYTGATYDMPATDFSNS